MSSVVQLTIHAPSVSTVSERRLPKDVPLGRVKERLELLCGVPPSAQKLSLWTGRTDDPESRATLVKRLDDGDDEDAEHTLERLGAQDGLWLLVEDVRDRADRTRFDLEEEENVQKYEMDDETYSQRQDSVLAFKQRMKLGRFAESKPDEPTAAASDALETMKVGSRCEVEGGRRGTIRFAGQTAFAKGSWVGVEYDEPVGKNDGSVAGKRYFTCTPKYGGFVAPEKVVVGDFPVRSIEDELEDDDEEM